MDSWRLCRHIQTGKTVARHFHAGSLSNSIFGNLPLVIFFKGFYQKYLYYIKICLVFGNTKGPTFV